MAIIYDLARLAQSGLKAQQSAQRDWSPLLVHFTSYAAMKSVRMLVGQKSGVLSSDVKTALDKADDKSYQIVHQILSGASPFLLARSPKPKEGIPDCVCLSECTLPGLFGHSERFGRFGFVFRKNAIFRLGGRPCLYMDSADYGWLDKQHDTDQDAQRVWGLSNVYTPAGVGRVQDFTVEREWRVFGNVPLANHLSAVLAPDMYVDRTSGLLKGVGLAVPVLPIDTLYDWGV